jgi:hypothetical protein
MADVQVELKAEKREEKGTTRKLAEAAKRTRGKTSPEATRGEDEVAESFLGQARSGHGNNVRVWLVDLAKQKKPRAQPVKKPRRLHWARKWAAEPEWEAEKERS